MQYMLLIYSPENAGPQPGSPEFGGFIQEYMEFTKTVNEDGVFVSGDALQSVSTATTVSTQSGKPVVTDGPFAETREQLGGYYLLDCESLEHAQKYAEMIPSARYGRIEIRPIEIHG